MSKEQELEELKQILIKIDYAGVRASMEDLNCPPPTPEEIAEAIQQAGYTKSPFDIEQLKAWLEENENKYNYADEFGEALWNKIQELERKT